MLTYAINPSGASGLRRLTALAALTALALPSAVAHAQNGLPAWIEPPEGSVRFGQAVASGADVDGDGINDIYVADPDYVANEQMVGRWFAYSGATREIIWSVVGEDLIGLSQGHSRFPAAFIDDFDGDRVADLLMARSDALDRRGVVEVYSGRTGERLHRVVGDISGRFLGMDVARLGDLDDDGVDEFAYLQPGAVTICSGASGEVIQVVQVEAARRVRDAGDVDGDGVSDFAVGQWGRPLAVSMISGRTRELIWVCNGPSGAPDFGYNLAAGHDLDGDAVPDVLVTGSDTSPVRFYVISGATGVEQLTYSMNAGASYVFWVSLGDVNGDGRVEPIVGAMRENLNASVAMHVYDHPPAPGPIENLAYTIDWAQPVGIVFGTEIAVADVTGDGCADLLLGSAQNGGVHVVGGSPMLLGHDVDYYAAFGEREVRRGFTHRFAAVGNAVGRPVRLAVSRRGNGCTFIPQLGICLDLDRPFQQIAQTITDADGFARFSIPIPADTTPGPVWMQCLDINFPRRGPSTSNVMRIEIVE